MDISYNWLEQYVDHGLEAEKLSEILTSLGLEVGGMKTFESIRGGLKGVVAGKVLTCGKHPNADRLSVCTVDVGAGEPLPIVCGAPNVAAGQMVWVATVGTELYPTGSEEPFKIGKAKVRGEVSEGMICAEDELGLGDDHDGIMVLPDSVEIGQLAADYYEITTDVIYDIDLTPNRSDATSHQGVARDLVAYLKVNGQPDIEINLPSTDNLIPENPSSSIEVEVRNSEACTRYAGVLIEGIEIGQSPAWLRTRLESIGVRPINNVVDITNFVLHEMGQPLHAFDADKIQSGKVIVQTLPEGTPFVTLDEVERKLTAADLMICDGDSNPMCIGGVFGGVGTGVTDETTRIFLESARFNPEWIRKTSMHHLLRTDAARTFEKSTDPAICVDALLRAAELIGQLANGKVTSELIDIYPEPVLPLHVKVRRNRINTLIGVDLPDAEVTSILAAMNMDVVEQDDTSITVAVPTDKADVTREADVIEEILRIHGFDNIPLLNKMDVGLRAVSGVTRHHLRNLLGSLLSAKGFNEMMGMSITEDANIDKGLLGIEADARVMIQNTSNVGLNTMRPDLMVSAVEAVRHNQNRNQDNFRFYEFGRGYTTAEANDIKEVEYLSLVMVGLEWGANWVNGSAKPSDFYTLKKYVDAVVQRTGMGRHQVVEAEDSRFDYGLTYQRGKEHIATFGKLSSSMLEEYGVRYDVFFAQIDFESLFAAMSRSSIVMKEISRFPGVKRDLAFVLSEEVSFNQLAGVVRKAAGNGLQDLELFDIYRSEKHLGSGFKSYAIQLTFEDMERTLSDKDVDAVIKKVTGAVEKQLEGRLRG